MLHCCKLQMTSKEPSMMQISVHQKKALWCLCIIIAVLKKTKSVSAPLGDPNLLDVIKLWSVYFFVKESSCGIHKPSPFLPLRYSFLVQVVPKSRPTDSLYLLTKHIVLFVISITYYYCWQDIFVSIKLKQPNICMPGGLAGKNVNQRPKRR
jgi:hypothetical protein